MPSRNCGTWIWLVDTSSCQRKYKAVGVVRRHGLIPIVVRGTSKKTPAVDAGLGAAIYRW